MNDMDMRDLQGHYFFSFLLGDPDIPARQIIVNNMLDDRPQPKGFRLECPVLSSKSIASRSFPAVIYLSENEHFLPYFPL